MLWSEKYRPKVLQELVGNQSIIQALIAYTKYKCIPNMVFCGSPGCGKTSAMRCVANACGLSEDDYLEVNTSDERGVETIRNKLKIFSARKRSFNCEQSIIFLDDADSMTHQAQFGLKALMDIYQKVAFVLGLNDVTCLHDSLRSRCQTMIFEPIPHQTVYQKLKSVASSENLQISPAHIRSIADNVQGDLRMALNSLQMIGRGKKAEPNRSSSRNDWMVIWDRLKTIERKNLVLSDLDSKHGLEHVIRQIDTKTEPRLIRAIIEIVTGRGSIRSAGETDESLAITRFLTVIRGS